MRRFWGFLCILFMLPLAAAAQTSNPYQPPGVTEQQADAAQTKEAHPTPTHTGWSSLLRDTGRDFMSFPRRKSTWTFVAIGAGAALATHAADDYVETHVQNNHVADHIFVVGKWAGSVYAQVGSAVGLWVVGRYVIPPAADEPKTNKYSHLGFDLIRAQILSQALVHGIKYSVQRDRPTGECCAFPSGHAATAFAAAAVLERHLGYRASWPALAGAMYVAASRLVDHRHFLSDVMFGAAIGEATGWTVVGRHGRKEYALLPVPVKGGMMISVVRVANDER